MICQKTFMPMIDLFATRYNLNTPVCIASPRRASSGRRCDAGRLESQNAVCIPSTVSSSKNDRQVSNKSSSGNAASSSGLSHKATLSAASTKQRIRYNKSASSTQSTETASSKRLPSESPSSKPSRLLVEESLREQGYSEDVVDRVTNNIRPTSISCYNAKWNIFIKYF